MREEYWLRSSRIRCW